MFRISDSDLKIVKAENIQLEVTALQEIINQFYSLMNTGKNETSKPSLLETKMNDLSLTAKISSNSKPRPNKTTSNFDEQIKELKASPIVERKFITAYKEGSLNKNAQKKILKTLIDPQYKSLPENEKTKVADNLISLRNEKKDPYAEVLAFAVMNSSPTNQLVNKCILSIINSCNYLTYKIQAINPTDLSDVQRTKLLQSLTSLNNTISTFVKSCGESK